MISLPFLVVIRKVATVCAMCLPLASSPST